MKNMKNLSVALFAHVDGGKTTLSEALLVKSGKIKEPGRVDHRDSYFDTFNQERDRGITIFSKQAELDFNYEHIHMTLLDTPGHVDFAAETERIMNVLDYAVLIINGREGVQSHSKTLWELLDKYRIPRFIFVNKMDIAFDSKEEILKNIHEKLSDGILDFEALEKTGALENGLLENEALLEEISLTDEKLLDEYLSKGNLYLDSIKDSIKSCKLAPVIFGSALKMEGVDQLIKAISALSIEMKYPEKFGGKVYKITQDQKGNRLTLMKITGGSLKLRDNLETGMAMEKVNEIRIYSGDSYVQASTAAAGQFIGIPGLKYTYQGQGIGGAKEKSAAYVQPLLRYHILCPEQMNKGQFIEILKEVADEIPELNLTYGKGNSDITISIMGKIQLEVLAQLIKDRYGIDVTFQKGKVIYQETVLGESVGIGHFEPLRHYAEAILLMEPGERGSGITFESNVGEDLFDLNFQRLIETHVFERKHRGILTGAPITDIKFTLLFGKWHKKHTVGGDFREATYRAIRNGLMKNKCALLEPYYEFILEIPSSAIGRAMKDLGSLCAKFSEPIIEGEMARIEGSAPAVTIMDYSEDIAKHTGGKGNIILKNGGYDLCHNEDEVVEMSMYDAEFDSFNTGDSVFCSHGSGMIVPWDQVDEYISEEGYQVLRNFYKKGDKLQGGSFEGDIFQLDQFSEGVNCAGPGQASFWDAWGRPEGGQEAGRENACLDKELERIFERTYGKKKDRTVIHKQVIRPRMEKVVIEKQVVKDSFVIVDGYNIIFAWDELKALAKKNLDSARDSLLEILSNYQGFTGCKMVVVFDAYKVKGAVRKSENIGGIDVVYTKEDETADSYIEKLTGIVGKDYYVQVATSDNLEQQVILGHGAHRISAKGFYEEIKRIDGVIKDVVAKYNSKAAQSSKTTIGDKMKKK